MILCMIDFVGDESSYVDVEVVYEEFFICDIRDEGVI